MRYVVKRGDKYSDGQGGFTTEKERAYVFDDDSKSRNPEPQFKNAREWAKAHAASWQARVVKLRRSFRVWP